MGQVEHLPSKHKALSSNPSIRKKKKREFRNAVIFMVEVDYRERIQIKLKKRKSTRDETLYSF
jgi:hypothetical protein